MNTVLVIKASTQQLYGSRTAAISALAAQWQTSPEHLRFGSSEQLAFADGTVREAITVFR